MDDVVQWLLFIIKFILLPQGTEVKEDVQGGVLLTESSLVIQTVSRQQAGSYSCGSSNSVAHVESAHLELQVRCEWWIFTIRKTYRLKVPYSC